MYKNLELKRQRDRERQAKRRDKGVTETPENVTPSGQGVTGLHTREDVNPWGWPRYNDDGERINPATMRPYEEMATFPDEVLTEYERKWVRPEYVPVRLMPRSQVDYLYRCLAKSYSSRSQAYQ